MQRAVPPDFAAPHPGYNIDVDRPAVIFKPIPPIFSKIPADSGKYSFYRKALALTSNTVLKLNK